jgi:hypothetical protein
LVWIIIYIRERIDIGWEVIAKKRKLSTVKERDVDVILLERWRLITLTFGCFT